MKFRTSEGCNQSSILKTGGKSVQLVRTQLAARQGVRLVLADAVGTVRFEALEYWTVPRPAD